MVYRNYTPDGFKEAVKEAEMLLLKAMLIGILVTVASISLLVVFPVIYMSFFVALGTSFGTIYFIQNYRGWRVVQDVKRKGRFDDEDRARMKSI